MMDEVERHNRQVMLLRVKRYWLVGVLQESLHGAELIDLSMAYRTTAVASRNAPEWQNVPGLDGAAFEQPLPVGTPISQVYDQAQGTLLIMGEPGAGKTTTLLQLVSDLLHRAETDENHPVPVVFSLASWHNHVGIGEWMVQELANRYEVPGWLGEEWLHNGRLLPLLDGLDEVDQNARIACARAINQFRQQYVTLPTVVTCRTQDYKALATRLNLDEAVVLQPLSGAQIDQYLASMGGRLAGLRAAIQADATLRELAESPLMLSIMTLAYYRMPQEAAIALGGRKEGRTFLFDTYVERMTRYRGGEELYDPQDSIRWLAWLARQMSKFNQTIFFLENMQPNWLPRQAERTFVEKLRFTIGGGFLGLGLLVGMLGWLLAGWPALLLGVGAGVVTAVLPAFFRIFLLHTRVNWHRIETVETLSWSWPWAWLGGALGAAGGFVAGGLGSGFSAPWLLYGGVLGGVSQVLEQALIREEMKLRTTPGQGIARSRRNGRRAALAAGGVTAVILLLFSGALALLPLDFSFRQAIPFILGAAVWLAASAGLVFGGLAAWQHGRLLRQLADKGNVPPDDYVQFLDYAAERNLLRKVGGGYMFAHALLLDYFQNKAD